MEAQLGLGDSLRFQKRSIFYTDNLKHNKLDVLVDSTLQSFMQSPQNCGISIGISQNGETTFYNYGEIRRDSKIQCDQNTIYEIGSLSSTFCGMLLIQAVLEKKISLEDDIRKYLPGKFAGLVYEKVSIRIKHLAMHTSGLPHLPGDLITEANFDPKDPYKNYSKEQIFMYLQKVKLSAEPGTVRDYSSLGVALLGIILEKIYATSFENLIKVKIASPFGMSNTAIHLTEQQSVHFAQGYNDDGEPTPHWNLNSFVAAGGIRSTTNDLLIYLNNNLEEKDKEKSALSWFIKKTKQGNTLMYQSGGTLGSGGFTGFIKEKKCSLVILANSGRNVDYIAIAILNYLQQ